MKLIILLLLSLKIYSQDTLFLKITSVKTNEDRVYYWLKDINTKEKYYTVCRCQPKRKGEIVKVLRRELEFIPGKILFE